MERAALHVHGRCERRYVGAESPQGVGGGADVVGVQDVLYA
jgi:hypothetical protein